MNKRIGCLLVAFVWLLTLLTGCGSGAANSKEETRAVDANRAYSEDAAMTVSGTAEIASARKVMITARYSVEAKDFSAAAKTLEQAVKTSGGYVEQAEIDGKNETNGSAEYVLRIPVDKLDSFTEMLEQVGTVSYSSQTAEDITDQYQDMQAQITARTTQRDRLLKLVEKAEKLDDLLRLEEELAQVQAQLDRLQGQQQYYDNRVEYATVSVSIWQSQLMQSTNVPYGSRLAKAFTGSFRTALEVLKTAGIVIVYLLPLLLTAAIVAVVIRAIVRGKRRRQTANRQAQDTKTDIE